MGYGFYIRNAPEKDLEMLLNINKIGFSFAQTIKPVSLMEYIISYDFHIKHQAGTKLLINHKLTPMQLT